jgi:selenide,water dikinase
VTDVTGFGLLGHLHELAYASGVAAEVEAESIPAIEGVLDLLRDDPHVVAGGTRRNREYAETFASFADGVEEARRWLACDAMTSGGLLAAVPTESKSLASGVVVGRLVEGPAGSISVV